MQLVAYGAQDVYLTGNPQITFFKVVYRRHTNFAMETIEETMTGNIRFGSKTSVTIIRNGDLATNCYLKVTLAACNTSAGKAAWCRRVGHALISSVTVSIGGSQIDKQYSTWLDLWYELTHTEEQTRGYAQMVGDVLELTELQSSLPQYSLWVPLQFWFNRNTGLALPLIALQYHEVRLDFEFANWQSLMCTTTDASWTGGVTPSIVDASLLVNYVYLDSEERRRFAQVGHEYLIEQVQFTGAEAVTVTSGNSTTGKYKLGFNHPTKELIWAVQSGNWTTGETFLAYSPSGLSGDSLVDVAATNLAKAMFYINPAGAGDVNVLSIAGDGVYSIMDISCNVTVLLGAGVNPSVSGTAFGTAGNVPTQYLWCVAQPFGTSNKLSGGLTDVVVVIGKDATQTVNGDFSTAGLNIESITVTSHTLTVRDVSIPISNLGTDNRVATEAVKTDVNVNNYSNYGLLLDGTGNPVSDALIQLNGQDRFDHQAGDYFNYVQPYQHHTHTPVDGVNVYSFALHPEQHQPSGSANLSRIDNTQLNLQFADSTQNSNNSLTTLNFFNNATLLYVFAFSYNVLRIMSGMGGLAYSN